MKTNNNTTTKRKRVARITKVASSNFVKNYNLKRGVFQANRFVSYSGLSHSVKLLNN